MKKNVFLTFIISFIAFSCTKEESNLTPLQPLNLTTATNTYVLNTPQSPICPPGSAIPTTNDVEITFSEPLPYDTTLEFKVYDITEGGNFEVPGYVLVLSAGENQGVLQTSCDFPERIQCGDISEIRSKTFRVQFSRGFYTGANGESFDYTAEFQDYIDITAYKSCKPQWKEIPGDGDDGDPTGPGGL